MIDVVGGFALLTHQAGHRFHHSARSHREGQSNPTALEAIHIIIRPFAHRRRRGNATTDLEGLSACVSLTKEGGEPNRDQKLSLPDQGWTVPSWTTSLSSDSGYLPSLSITDPHGSVVGETSDLITANSSLPVPSALFAYLHKVAGLDVVGYTANDFNITKQRWNAALVTTKKTNSEGEFGIFPGTEWCRNSAAGGDHNVVFLEDPVVHPPEFDKHGNVAQSLEWNEDGPAELIPVA
ncbi:putative DUF3604 domain-containing protein [Seiridium cardinale]|uniref:DUF3604 domain-containing protein n=1 Tax=Seiridium cardinale TaxID=138064 RepID=A0ABR2YA05_9PEZI